MFYLNYFQFVLGLIFSLPFVFSRGCC